MKTTEDYFYFTRAELRAGILLLFLVLLIRLLPLWLQSRSMAETDFSALNELDSLLNSDTMQTRPAAEAANLSAGAALAFPFDPNTAAESDFIRLGFKPYLARRIGRYRTSGAVFKYREDLRRIYGMDTHRLKAVWHCIRLPEKPQPAYSAKAAEARIDYTAPKPPLKPKTDLNTADTSALIALPGIGSRLARRIVELREKLGGFYSLEQLGEVYGLSPETTARLLPMLELSGSSLRVLDINVLDKESLGRHPYIGYRAAAALLAYRREHGPFTTLDDVRKTLLFSDAQLSKLKYYLKF